MLDNYDLKQPKLNEVIEIFDEFSDLNDGEFSSEELFHAASNFIEIARGKISKEKVNDRKGYPSYYAQDTYTVMTRKPWKTLYEYYGAYDFCDQYSDNWNRYNQISKGWN
ncbi:hypothetical protein OAM56_05935 [Alphaproteobacteria bacterium]|nr:hypothetical protein [Alphaproteobacteria bacterium]